MMAAVALLLLGVVRASCIWYSADHGPYTRRSQSGPWPTTLASLHFREMILECRRP